MSSSNSERNPAVEGLRDYHVKYVGMHHRAGLEGIWTKRMEFWKDDEGRQMGAWRWVPAEEADGLVDR